MGETKHYTVDRASLASVVILLGGMAQFGINLSVAVTSFGDRYSFSRNFLSDLGRAAKPSAPYFNVGVILLGLSLTVFFANAARQDDRRVFGIAGIVSAAGLVGIGLTPLDRYFLEHHIFLVMWLLPMFVMIFSSIQMFDGSIRRFVIIAGLTLWLLMSLYVSSAGSHSAPFHQKIVVIFAIGWLLLICYHSTFAVVREFVSRSSIGKDSKTRAYIQRLETSGLYSKAGRRAGNQYAEHDTDGRPSMKKKRGTF